MITMGCGHWPHEMSAPHAVSTLTSSTVRQWNADGEKGAHTAKNKSNPLIWTREDADEGVRPWGPPASGQGTATTTSVVCLSVSP